MTGWMVINGLGFLVRKPVGPIHPTLTMLAGLMAITFLADIVSLFFPLNQIFFFVLVGFALLIAIYRLVKNPQKLRFHHPHLLPAQYLILFLGLFIFVIILDLSSRLPANADTAIYHAQAIHWIETYPAVPGLGNLHSRLAYNSNWLLDNAVFSFTWTGNSGPYTVLPGLLVLLSIFYFLGGLWQLARHQISPAALIKTLLIPLFFIVSPSEVSSPGTDLPAVFLTWVILCECLDGLLDIRETLMVRQLLILSLAVFAATIKLSVLPLLLLPLILGIWHLRQKDFRWLSYLIVIGFFILGAWMTRNVILSGYLIYPLPQLDLFSFDWKIPHVVAVNEINSISNWARHIWIGADEHANSLPIQEWVPLWFKAETVNHKGLICTAAMGLLIYAVLLVNKPTRQWLIQVAGESYLVIFGIVYTGCIYWFLSAPDFRFGYSFILFSILLIFLPLMIKALSINWINRLFPLFLVIVFILFQVGFYLYSFKPESFTTRLVHTEPYPSSPTSSCKFGNFSTWCADIYNQCWYNPFPCVPRPLLEVSKRSDDLKDGFRFDNSYH
jgi:hypothetical protein